MASESQTTNHESHKKDRALLKAILLIPLRTFLEEETFNATSCKLMCKGNLSSVREQCRILGKRLLVLNKVLEEQTSGVFWWGYSPVIAMLPTIASNKLAS